jgi:hypothetical protein
MRRLSLGLLFAALLATLVPATAHARKQQDHTYRFEQVWSAAVRMVRVDLRYPIEDQDPSIGYVLFQYQDRGRAFPGSIELVRTRVEGVDYIRTVVQIPSMPSYVEQMLLDRLERKLRAEFGDPPEQPRRERRPSDRGDEDEDEHEDEGDDPSDDDGDRSRRRGRRD